MASHPFFLLLGYGPCYYHLIHVEDLTDIMILAASHPAARGEVFICGNEEPTTLADIGRTATDPYARARAYLIDKEGVVRQVFPSMLRHRAPWQAVINETRRVLTEKPTSRPAAKQ